jgi:hypothetical protein
MTPPSPEARERERRIERIVEEAVVAHSTAGGSLPLGSDRAVAREAARLAWTEAVERACVAFCGYCKNPDEYGRAYFETDRWLHSSTLGIKRGCQANAVRSFRGAP